MKTKFPRSSSLGGQIIHSSIHLINTFWELILFYELRKASDKSKWICSRQVKREVYSGQKSWWIHLKLIQLQGTRTSLLRVAEIHRGGFVSYNKISKEGMCWHWFYWPVTPSGTCFYLPFCSTTFSIVSVGFYCMKKPPKI